MICPFRSSGKVIAWFLVVWWASRSVWLSLILKNVSSWHILYFLHFVNDWIDIRYWSGMRSLVCLEIPIFSQDCVLLRGWEVELQIAYFALVVLFLLGGFWKLHEGQLDEMCIIYLQWTGREYPLGRFMGSIHSLWYGLLCPFLGWVPRENEVSVSALP